MTTLLIHRMYGRVIWPYTSKLVLSVGNLLTGQCSGFHRSVLLLNQEDKSKTSDATKQMPPDSTAALDGSDGLPRKPMPQSHSTTVYFDTHRVIQDLQGAGYTLQQAEKLVATLNGVICSTLAAPQTSRKDLEMLELKVKSEVESVRNNVLLLEKTSVAALKNECESLKAQIAKLHDNVKIEVAKLQSGLRLDFNLERSRSKEESTMIDQKIKDTHNRIGTEAAQLRTQIEAQKLESIKYLAGGIFSMVTIVLSVMLGLSRLLK